ncbi:MAG: hypothetical protein M5U22_00890 [Thermoleophilia bacterium]|nr:hypothetical protein [Thermoleophilia bacterium]
MHHTQQCDHCRAEIPLFAWVCPDCGHWVGEITRHGCGDLAKEPIAA